MGLTSSSDNKRTFLSVLSKKKNKGLEKSQFGESVKQADGWGVVPTGSDTLSGNLEKITTGSYEYDGDVIKTMSLLMKDGDTGFDLQANYSYRMVSVLNYLAGAETLSTSDIIELNVWDNENATSKDKTRIYVKVNGEPTEPKFGMDEGPQDLEEAIELFISEINQRLESNVPKVEMASPEPVREPAGDIDDPEDDLPF